STGLRIQKKYVRFDLKIMSKIAALGVAPFIMQSTESLVSIVLNRGLQSYGGDLYVGSMTIIQSIMQMIVMPIQGITQGVQPIMSYNYGAGKYDRVRKTFFLLLRTTLTITVICCLLVVFFPAIFARMFTPKAELIALVTKVMPIFMAGIWAFGAQMACQTTFMSLGQAKTSLFLALLRKIILLIPLAIILPMLTHSVLGIYAAEPIADIVASCTTLILFLTQYKKLLPKENK
ncbi:MAG: MATE family efflux transporter, partial [Oscillospiraceae bacterium]